MKSKLIVFGIVIAMITIFFIDVRLAIAFSAGVLSTIWASVSIDEDAYIKPVNEGNYE